MQIFRLDWETIYKFELCWTGQRELISRRKKPGHTCCLRKHWLLDHCCVPLESESSIQNHTKVLVVGLVTKYSTKRGNAWTALWPCGEFDTSTFIAGYAFVPFCCPFFKTWYVLMQAQGCNVYASTPDQIRCVISVCCDEDVIIVNFGTTPGIWPTRAIVIA